MARRGHGKGRGRANSSISLHWFFGLLYHATRALTHLLPHTHTHHTHHTYNILTRRQRDAARGWYCTAPAARRLPGSLRPGCPFSGRPAKTRPHYHNRFYSPSSIPRALHLRAHYHYLRNTGTARKQNGAPAARLDSIQFFSGLRLPFPWFPHTSSSLLPGSVPLRPRN